MASDQQPLAVPRWKPSPPRRQSRPDAAGDDEGPSDSDLGGSLRSTDGFPFGSLSGSSTFPPPPPPFVPRQQSSSSLEIISVENAQNGAGGFVANGNGAAVVVRRETSLRRVDQGVVLSWEDLWVSAAGGGGGGTKKPILRGLNGYARPGEVLAIMGPSGCGKSTLLDALAGRLGSNVSQKGEILINGRRQKLSFGTSAYVTQDDVLMTTLTVREAVHYSASLQLPAHMPAAAKRERAEETLREMGLLEGNVADTRIGGWAHKGISGGQKRRVSICMEILTRPALLFLDEPTSGLDSAASYHVVSRIARLARREGMAVVAAVHQPSTEVFGLFSGLCLLAYGNTVFFGPAADANQDIEEGLGGKKTTTAQAIDALVTLYRSSGHMEKVTRQIADIRNGTGGPVVKMEGQHPSFLTQSLVLTKRSFVNMYRDLGYYWLRFGIYLALCLCAGTIFYDIGHTYGSIQARGSILMFVGAFLTFMAIGGFPSFVEDMKIFGRERLNGHYGVSSFVIANTVSATPYLLLISVVPGALAYYLVGLQRSFDHFAYFALVLFMTMMLVEGLMMIVASAVPDFLMGIITGAGIQGVMMLNGGFFRLPRDLPRPVWRYPMYYVAFHKYANQGFYKNEFMGLTFPRANAAAQAGPGASATVTGGEILRDYWQVEMGYSKWVDLAVLFGMVIIYRVLFLVIVKLTEKVKPMVKGFRFRSTQQSVHVAEHDASP
ncbi:hypothetical protein BRADI_4g32850v3 [Brachypodium distachyon]|uniref:ABC transporter domain-containing protein n=1 Tax=Brachypodium distachyon TaxID=15368 RepID=A0A0Q3HQY0_BRADI|nr:hypothetical protein BRADI_4g32850v3 [Brachypodium distachyon]